MKKKKIKFKKLNHSHRKKEGYTIFPSTHDITPENIEHSLEFINRLLINGNQILLVSKPHLSVIKAICEKFVDYKNKIWFRFTIGSCDPEILNFWTGYNYLEPDNSPSISD